MAFFSAAASRRRGGDRRGGRVVVFGRNYETNIKHKKGPAEAAKAKIVRKHLQGITMCCKEFGADVDINRRLPRLIKAAIRDNCPRDTVNRTIKKFNETKDSIIQLEMSGIGVQGVGFLVSAVTDNATRTRVDVKEAFKDIGGRVGDDGSLSHIFRKEGVMTFKGVDEDQIMEASMEAEVEDVQEQEDGSWKCITLPQNFHSTMDAFESQGLEPASSTVEVVYDIPITLNEEGTYETMRLLHLLEECDDVGEVSHNAILQEGVELVFNQYGKAMKYKPPK